MPCDIFIDHITFHQLSFYKLRAMYTCSHRPSFSTFESFEVTTVALSKFLKLWCPQLITEL